MKICIYLRFIIFRFYKAYPMNKPIIITFLLRKAKLRTNAPTNLNIKLPRFYGTRNIKLCVSPHARITWLPNHVPGKTGVTTSQTLWSNLR